MQVRGYTDNDYEAVVELYKNSDLYGGQFDEDRDSRQRLARQILTDSKSILVCELNLKNNISDYLENTDSPLAMNYQLWEKMKI